MSDIFREVDEEVRRSQAEAVWKRYGWLIIAACVAIVGGTAAYRFYEWRKEQSAAAGGAQFQQALVRFDASDAAGAEAILGALSRQDAAGYAVLAKFRLASELSKRDAAAGMRAFDALAGDATIDAGLRDVARLRAGAVAVDNAGIADVENRLQPLTSATNAFRHQANELLAAAALKAGDMPKAAKHLDAIIIDRNAPAGLRSRAETLIGVTRGAK